MNTLCEGSAQLDSPITAVHCHSTTRAKTFRSRLREMHEKLKLDVEYWLDTEFWL